MATTVREASKSKNKGTSKASRESEAVNFDTTRPKTKLPGTR